MLGRLARWLRFLGYDTLYPEVLDDDELLALAGCEARLLLTRDKRLCERANGVYVNSTNIKEQLRQVVRELNLDCEKRMSRCSVCNTLIVEVAKEAAREHVPSAVYQRQATFWRCPTCGRFYWAGSHYDRILTELSNL